MIVLLQRAHLRVLRDHLRIYVNVMVDGDDERDALAALLADLDVLFGAEAVAVALTPEPRAAPAPPAPRESRPTVQPPRAVSAPSLAPVRPSAEVPTAPADASATRTTRLMAAILAEPERTFETSDLGAIYRGTAEGLRVRLGGLAREGKIVRIGRGRWRAPAPASNPGRTHFVGDDCPGGHRPKATAPRPGTFTAPTPPATEAPTGRFASGAALVVAKSKPCSHRPCKRRTTRESGLCEYHERHPSPAAPVVDLEEDAADLPVPARLGPTAEDLADIEETPVEEMPSPPVVRRFSAYPGRGIGPKRPVKAPPPIQAGADGPPVREARTKVAVNKQDVRF